MNIDEGQRHQIEVLERLVLELMLERERHNHTSPVNVRYRDKNGVCCRVHAHTTGIPGSGKREVKYVFEREFPHIVED